MKANSKKFLVISLFAFTMGLMISYFIMVAASYPINPLSLPPRKTTLNFEITYPPVTNEQLPDTWFLVTFKIEAKGVISEGVNLTVINAGGRFFSEDYAVFIDKVYIGFEHSQPISTFVDSSTGQTHTYAGPYNIWLNKHYINNSDYILEQMTTPTSFSFPASGSYHPTIVVRFENNTYSSHTYDEIDLPVVSKTELRSQISEQISIFISIVLFALTIIEAMRLIQNWNPKDDEEGT